MTQIPRIRCMDCTNLAGRERDQYMYLCKDFQTILSERRAKALRHCLHYCPEEDDEP